MSPSGTRAWVFMWRRVGKRTVMGLGPYPAVGLADARERAADCRKQLAAGKNPLAEARREVAPTFRVAVDRFLDDGRLATWRNAKHRDQWRMTLSGPAEPKGAPKESKRKQADTYCKPILDSPSTRSAPPRCSPCLSRSGQPSRDGITATRPHRAGARLRRGAGLAPGGQEPGNLAERT